MQGSGAAESADFASFASSLVYSPDNSPAGTQIKVQYVDSGTAHGYFLFLPSTSAVSSLQASSLTSPDGGWSVSSVSCADLPASPEAGTAYEFAVSGTKDGGASTASGTLDVVATNASAVSSMYLTSDDAANAGRSYVEAVKGNTASGTAAFVDADGKAFSFKDNNKIKKIKLHGNSSIGYPKKSYQVNFDKKQKLLGKSVGGSKKWQLLACYNDPTKLLDKTWKDVAAALGYAYTPHAGYTNLYYDGEYRGIYELSTKIEVGEDRVKITDMEDAYEDAGNTDYGEAERMSVATATNKYGAQFWYTEGLTDPDELGGFLLEWNDWASDEANSFKDRYGYNVNLKSPEYASKAAVEYISEWYYEFEVALAHTDENGNHDGLNPDTKKRYDEYCDLDSLVRLYLLNTVSSNADSFWHSTYFYKDKNSKGENGTSKMYCGPMWDFDMTMGTGWTGDVDARTDQLASHAIVNDLLQIESFQTAVKKYYSDHFDAVQSALAGDATATGIDSLQDAYEKIAGNVRADRLLWPQMLKNNSASEYWPSGTTVQDVVNEKVHWTRVHKVWLDSYFADMVYHQWGAAVYNGNGTHTRTAVVTATDNSKATRTEACSFVSETVREPTAQQKGLVRYTCSVCGGSYEVEVDNAELADRAAAGAVDEAIAAIGEVAPASEAAVGRARAAYDALTDTQKGYVASYETLVGAEAVLAYLKKTQAPSATTAEGEQGAATSTATGESTTESGQAPAAGGSEQASEADAGAAQASTAAETGAESESAGSQEQETGTTVSGGDASATGAEQTSTTNKALSLGTVFAKGGAKYLLTGSKSVACLKAPNKKTVTIPATVKSGGRSYKVTAVLTQTMRKSKKARKLVVGKNVKAIEKNALKGTKVKTVVLKTKLLTAKATRGFLKGSRVLTVKVSVGGKKANAKWAKKYKRVLSKKSCGKKVAVKR